MIKTNVDIKEDEKQVNYGGFEAVQRHRVF